MMYRADFVLILATSGLFSAGVASSSVSADPPPLEYGSETTVITEPRFEDGRIDYLQALNDVAAEGVTSENNAGLDILWMMIETYLKGGTAWSDEALRRLNVNQDPGHPGYIRFREFVDEELIDKYDAESELDQAIDKPWANDDYPLIARWLDRNRAALEAIANASRKERFYIPMFGPGQADTPMVVDALLPHLAFLRDVSKALRARSNQLLALGDMEAAWSDLLVIKRLARLLSQEPMLVSYLSATGLDWTATQGTTGILQNAALNDDTAKRLLDDLRQLSPFPSPVRTIDFGERFMKLDWAQRKLTVWLPYVNATLTAGDVAALRLVGKHYDANLLMRMVNTEVARTINALVEQRFLIAKEQLGTQEAEWESMWIGFDLEETLSRLGSAESTQATREEFSRGLFIYTETLRFQKVNEIAWRVRAHHAIEEIAVALAAHHAVNGSWPDDLAALTPAYLDSVPQDPFNEAPFLYRIDDDGGVTIWSVGTNLENDDADPAAGDVVMTLH